MLGQLSRFASVGVMSTLLHVLTAMIAKTVFGIPPQGANLCGFFAAVSLSYFGHGRFTFDTDLQHRFHGPRFLGVSALGLAVSSGLTFLITDIMGLAFAIAMAVVAVAVPASTFIMCKFWVFATPQRDGP